MSWVSPDDSPEGLAGALETRAALLAALADGPREKRALREELGVARSTVYKGLRELAALGLVRETGGGYALTALGRLGSEAHEQYRDRLADLSAARSVLAAVPADVGVPGAFVADATVATADRNAPQRPLATFESAVEGADCVRSLSPAAIPRYMADLHEDVVTGQVRELVVERPAAAALEASYGEFDDAIAAGLDVYPIAEPLPFGLTLFDEESAALTTYEEGGVSGVLLSDAPEAYAWADETYEEYRSRGEKL
jgi:predicted transcriptional regulator